MVNEALERRAAKDAHQSQDARSVAGSVFTHDRSSMDSDVADRHCVNQPPSTADDFEVPTIPILEHPPRTFT